MLSINIVLKYQTFYFHPACLSKNVLSKHFKTQVYVCFWQRRIQLSIYMIVDNLLLGVQTYPTLAMKCINVSISFIFYVLIVTKRFYLWHNDLMWVLMPPQYITGRLRVVWIANTSVIINVISKLVLYIFYSLNE